MPYSTLEEVCADEKPHRSEEQTEEAEMFRGAAHNLIIGVGIQFVDAFGNRRVVEMLQAEFLTGWYAHDFAVDLRLRVDERWPCGAVFKEESQLIVGVFLETLAHKAVSARNGESILESAVGNGIIEIVSESGRYNLVCIYNEYPGISGGVDGEIACRLADGMVAFGKSVYAATELGGDIACIVGALHIADNNLVEAGESFEHPAEMLRGVVCVDNDRNLIFHKNCRWTAIARMMNGQAKRL